MKLIVASDEKTDLTKSVIQYLQKKGHQVILMGDLLKKNDQWAKIGMNVAQKVANGEVNQAILF